MNTHVLAITATCGRHTCIERSVGMFLAQDYEGKHTQLIFNNSKIPQEIKVENTNPNKEIILINRSTNSQTGNPYSSLGEIYNDILHYIPDYIGIVTHWDDDDAFLPNHLSEGVKGLERCGKKAYKPRHSWYRHSGGTELMNNTLEPSIFIKKNFLLKHGYNEGSSVAHHLKWVTPLIKEGDICSEEDAPATMIYIWGRDVSVFKTSGAGETPQNFSNYRQWSQDHGDRIITPSPYSSYKHLFDGIPHSTILS